jgi:transposase
MRRRGTAAELEVRREIAGRMLLQGRKLREVAEACDVNISSVKRWKLAVREGGLAALASEGRLGRQARLSGAQEARLTDILLSGPVIAGYRNDLWTCGRVAEIIENRFGVRYHLGHVWKILRRLGFSCQKPEQVAREQDPDAVYRWRRYKWPTLKKGHSNAS